MTRFEMLLVSLGGIIRRCWSHLGMMSMTNATIFSFLDRATLSCSPSGFDSNVPMRIPDLSIRESTPDAMNVAQCFPNDTYP